ncbi:MAG: nucleotidyltransferase family protein [Oscillospiraceae bacterium]|nr:nucleotidyltransferase family protein [Oscillospiraceae bacterium]
MSELIQGILTLLRCAIKEEDGTVPQGFSLAEAEPLLAAQSLLPMAFHGVFRCGFSLKDPILQRWRLKYIRIAQHSEQQVKALHRLLDAFEENGIDHMPVKGSILKEMYPVPEMRMMGDADILIREEQYERVRAVMLQQGYEAGQEEPDVFVWKSPALYLELHKRLFGFPHNDMWRYFGSGWEKTASNEGFCHAMSVEDAYLYIFCHMTKHFRQYGVGARQIIDLYVYRNAHPEMNEELLEKALKRLHLYDFHRNILRLLQVWFEEEPWDPVSEQITQYVFSNGNWGSTENAMYAEVASHIQENGNTGAVKAVPFIDLLFPAKGAMQQRFAVLKKYPGLYPLFWPIRWINVLLKRRSRIVKKFSTLHGISREKAEAYYEMMQSAGLDFRYMKDDEK